MGGGVIQQDDDEVPQHLPQMNEDFFLADVVEEEQIVKAQSLSLGAQRNSGDHRNLVPSAWAMAMNGSLLSSCAQVLTTDGIRRRKPDSSAKTIGA